MYLLISFSGLYNSCLSIFQHIESTIKVVNSSQLRGCPNLQAVKVKCPDFNIVAFYWSPNTLLAEDLENVAKGQLISEEFLLSSDTPKNQRNFVQIFALASKKWLKQKIKALDDTNSLLGAIQHNKGLLCFLFNPFIEARAEILQKNWFAFGEIFSQEKLLLMF